MLKLRRGTVRSAEPLTVEVDGEERRAWADVALVGPIEDGDEVIVNVEALDLGLGSGGFDVVHANLTRGLGGEGRSGAHVMKLNYTSIQHPIEPVEAPADATAPPAVPVLVLPLHGHLAPAAWAAADASPGIRAGYVQTAGGALPGSMSQVVGELRNRGLICGHVTAGPSYGGEFEAVSVAGALDAAARESWDAVLCGPGPGIIGSATRYGHGGMAALDAAHASLALGFPTLVSPRLSSGDRRPRHRGLSHHTGIVLELLLAPVRVPVPEADVSGWPIPDVAAHQGSADDALDALQAACADRHDLLVRPVGLDGYADSGLPTRTMGRDLAEDPLFFAAPLASGRALGEEVGGR